ncbi:MAG TPA: head-tail connector protein [Clostridia bacterium]
MILDDIKTCLRIKNSSFDTEINDLISACQNDLMLSGIIQDKALDVTDPLIKRAIIVYCKAYFGFDNPDADRLQESYKMLKMHLCLSSIYGGDLDAI